MLPLRCFLIIIIAVVLPAALSARVALATATITTALGYELLIPVAALRGALVDEEVMRHRSATPGVLSRFLLMKAPRNIRPRARAPASHSGS